MKPCIIKWNSAHQRHEAFNEDGREVAYSHISYRMLEFDMQEREYEVVPLNSRLGRTIQDKIEQHSI